MDSVDLAVIGAGPAGMAAAVAADAAGLSVAILDEQPSAGGQIYRAITAGGAARAAILGPDYLRGAALAEALARSGARHLAGATVWRIDREGEGLRIAHSRRGQAAVLDARALVLATGALERPVPLPGWTLPGVMTAGAAQILLKASGVVPEGAVLAGSGPLLYLVAVQLLRAGRPPRAIVDTAGGAAGLLAAAPRLPAALAGWRTLARGLGLLATLGRAGLPHHRGARDLAIAGAGRAEALHFVAGGRRHSIAAATVLLHQGVIPNTQASRALGLAHVWDDGQRAFRPQTDAWGESATPGIFVAGDGAGIAGAVAAAHAGRIVGLAAAHRLGAIDRTRRDREAAPARRALAAERALRPLLEALFPPPAAALRPDDATIICRCEEVTAGQLRGWARQGAIGPNQAKAFGRCGMGPCQGRFCGPTITEILAEVHGQDPAAIGALRIRPPLKPVTLGELATLAPQGSGTAG